MLYRVKYYFPECRIENTVDGILPSVLIMVIVPSSLIFHYTFQLNVRFNVNKLSINDLRTVWILKLLF